jgi:hypothetical protein
MARQKSNPLTDRKEIEANKSGQITDRQRRLVSEMLKPFNYWWLGLFFFGAGLAIAMMGLLSEEPFLGMEFLLILALLTIGGGLLAMAGLIFHVRRWWLLRGLDKEPIDSGSGRIRWRGSVYRAEMDGRTLKAPVEINLQPGDYKFYTMPKRGWLLSAELVSGVSDQDLAEIQSNLARAIRFSPNDLAANRDGNLTSGQARSLVIQLLGSLLMWLILIALGAMILAVLVNDFVQSERLSPGWLIVAPCGAVMGAFIILASIGEGRKELRKLVADIRGRKVWKSEGQVTKSVREDVDDEGGVDRSFYYTIGRRHFKVSRVGYAALVEGLTYRVYYTPKTRRLTSIELVKEENDTTNQEGMK